MWQRFLYRDSVMLEAERQRSNHGYVDTWAAKFSELTQDDAFATFLQVHSVILFILQSRNFPVMFLS